MEAVQTDGSKRKQLEVYLTEQCTHVPIANHILSCLTQASLFRYTSTEMELAEALSSLVSCEMTESRFGAVHLMEVHCP